MAKKLNWAYTLNTVDLLFRSVLVRDAQGITVCLCDNDGARRWLVAAAPPHLS